MTTMQALFPVYLPRSRKEDQAQQDYDIAVAQNEANLKQNLENLYNQVLTLNEITATQAATIERQAIVIQELREAKNNG